MVMNTKGNVKDHMHGLRQKSNKVLEINTIGAKSQLGTEEIRMKLKLFELCLMPAMLHGLAAWRRILTREIDEIECKAKRSNSLLQVSISALTAGLLMETGI